MSAIIVIGSQWGDEGKGKLVDAFAAKAEAVVRFQGGANAGHTLIVNGEKTVLHLIPSGVLHSHVQCLIASGVTVDPFEVVKEIQGLQKSGYLKDSKKLMISDGALLVLPFHKQLDVARENYKNKEKLGTTGRGIGPSYEDRASRRALLFRDLFSDDLKEKLEKCAEEKNFLLEKLYGEKPIDIDSVYKELKEASELLKPYRCENPSHQVSKWLKENKNVLFEGAQGVLLDNFHGTYPFVTSSSTLSASACASSGIDPGLIDRVFGITKAYCTRVGSGPFPTELEDETGDHLQKEGHEFGATTGRRRRCGWLDLVALKYAVHVGGINGLVLTKLDVLSKLDTIKVCTGYRLKGQEISDFPLISNEIGQVEPVYKELQGWKKDISKCQSVAELPPAALEYVRFISDFVDVPVSVVSVGPDRKETLYQEEIFQGFPRPRGSEPSTISLPQ